MEFVKILLSLFGITLLTGCAIPKEVTCFQNSNPNYHKRPHQRPAIRL